MLDRLTPEAKKVIESAQESSIQAKQEYLGTEQLLLAIATHPTPFTAQYQFDVNRIKKEISNMVQPNPFSPARGPLPFTPRTKIVLELADVFSQGGLIDVDDLLYGICQDPKNDGGGVGREILERLGCSPQRIIADYQRSKGQHQ